MHKNPITMFETVKKRSSEKQIQREKIIIRIDILENAEIYFNMH